MSRCVFSQLHDTEHADLIDPLTSWTIENFLSLENLASNLTPAIYYLLPLLFPTIKNGKPLRTLQVWFRGVRLEFLKTIQSKIDRSWSTEEVKNKYVLEQTISTPTKLLADIASTNQRGPASIFISHAWRNRYFDLVEVCEKYPGAFFFNDIIAIQQHQMKRDDMILDLKALPWIIGASACFLLVTDMKLVPLGRIWCLYELYHCLVSTKSKLVVEFTSEGIDDQSDTGMWDVASDIEKRINSIDARKADATEKRDKVRILDEIEQNVPGGIEAFNSELKIALKKEWDKSIREQWGWKMMQTVGRAVRKVAILESKLVALERNFQEQERKFQEQVMSLTARLENLEQETIDHKSHMI